MCTTIETRPFHPQNRLHNQTARHLRRAVACLVKLNELHAEHCTEELCSCDAFDAWVWHIEMYANSISGEILYAVEDNGRSAEVREEEATARPASAIAEAPDVPTGVRIADGTGNPFYTMAGR